MNEWAILAAFLASGILVAWLRRPRPSVGQGRGLDEAYLKGLNLLLNDQQDEAIDLFVRVLEVNHETVEIHLALGKLFRQRGEVERAIRLHQNLIARPNLSQEQKEQALYELGRDYLCAGLLDRAERLFSELASSRRLGTEARRQLLGVYEEEKEWEQAIEVARRLEKGRYVKAIAHYHCELAEKARACGEMARAQRHLRRALGSDARCVRATLLFAELELERARPRKAVPHLMRVRDQDPDYLPLVVEPLMSCYRQLGEPRKLADQLETLFAATHGYRALAAWLTLLRERVGDQSALEQLRERLRERPSVRALLHYLDLEPAEGCAGVKEELTHVLGRLAEPLERYLCEGCGLEAGHLYWRCPSCKGWGLMKPVEESCGG